MQTWYLLKHQNGDMWHCCWSGLSISEMADLLGFSCITVFKVYIEWPKRQKLFSEWQISE